VFLDFLQGLEENFESVFGFLEIGGFKVHVNVLGYSLSEFFWAIKDISVLDVEVEIGGS